jgi:hypothetical protein
MTQKFYLRDLTAADPPSAGEKSTAHPKFTIGANNATGTQETRALDASIGASNFSHDKSSDATVSTRSNYMGRFTSAALAAQTFGSGTWTLAIELSEANVNADSFLACSVYVWRPSSSSVVGFIYDNTADLGTEWGSSRTGKVQTFTGADITCLENDVLVVEVWRQTDATGQAMATAYTQSIFFNGGTDVTVGSTAAGGSYLQAPADVAMAGGAAGPIGARSQKFDEVSAYGAGMVSV